MRKPVIILLVVLVFVVSLTLYAQKTFAATIETAKENGASTDIFLIGEKVRVIANSQIAIVEVTVTDPDGIIRFTENVYTLYYDKTIDGITDKVGTWTVTVIENRLIQPKTGTSPEIQASSSKNYSTISIHAVPETPLGTITTIVMLAAAIGIIAKRNSFRLIKR